MLLTRFIPTLLVLLLAFRAGGAEDLPVLRTVQDVRALSNEEAARGYPIQVRGVITFSGNARGLHFVADSTGGIYLSIAGSPVPCGKLVEIHGRSRVGRTVPYIDTTEDDTSSIVVRGGGEMPKALRPEPHQLVEARFDAQLVKVEGRVESVTEEVYGASVVLAVGQNRLRIVFPQIMGRSTAPTYLQGFQVTATGVLGAMSPLGEPQQLYVTSLRDVEINPQELEDRFAGAQLFPTFGWSPPAIPQPARLHRVSGQVVYVEPGVGFFLAFGPELRSMWVYSPQAADFEFGQHVEVVGKPDPDHQPLMRNAVARHLPSEDHRPPVPDRPLVDDPFDWWYGLHGKLITVDLPLRSIQTGLPGEQNLILEGKGGLIFGRVRQVSGSGWQPTVGSLLRVTGVCILKNAEDFGLDSVAFRAQLLIRNPGDIKVLKEPPFWTEARRRWLVWGSLGASAFAFAWVVTLRRRVHSQMGIIGSQLERQAIHDERARLAREWHDSLQQQLIGVSIQVQAAAAQCHQAPELATRMLGRADAMLQHSQAEARRSVWNLRNGILEQQGLAVALRELRLNEPGGATVEVRSSGDVSRRLPAETEYHLLRIAQQAVANALQHAGARLIELMLWADAETVTLSITDDGCGFDPATAAAADGAHFGLLGMKERAAKIQAQLVIDTEAGRGTKTTVTLKNVSFLYSATPVRS